MFRKANASDWPGIWEIIEAVVETGDTYPYPADLTEVKGRDIWMQVSDRSETYVATIGNEIVGTAYLKPNQTGLGDHIANAGWMIARSARGEGVGREFAEFVMGEARRIGFEGMQFNSVVASNENAIGLWKSLGFEIVGTVPDAFRHAILGPIPVHVMYRKL